MSRLFETSAINGMTLKNRFVRSATWEGLAEDDGTVTPALVKMMADLASGGVGLIITGHAYIEPRGKAGIRQLGIYDDCLVPGLSDMARAVHEKGGRIVAQLNHSGLFGDPKITGLTPFAPSALDGFTDYQPDEITEPDFQDLVAAFDNAAGRAREAGFDGIQIHAAHGYLLSQCLSPFFNRRRDSYGGDIRGRIKILLEVLSAVRARVGRDYPVLVKMNTRDFLEGGLELDEAVIASEILEKNGVDAIELSGGTGASGALNPVRNGILKENDEAYFRDAARVFRENLGLPLMLVGGIRSFHIAEAIVDGNTADYVSMCRPFIREPGLVNRWKSGDRSKAACISDSRCFVPAMGGEGLYCVMEKKRVKKQLSDDRVQRAEDLKTREGSK